MNTAPRAGQVSLIHVLDRPRRSVANHHTCSPTPLSHATPQRAGLPACKAGPGFAIHSQARRHARPNRVRFLRTGSSPPVALDPASRRRRYLQLQAGERVPGEDLHLSDQVHFQTHECGDNGTALDLAQKLSKRRHSRLTLKPLRRELFTVRRFRPQTNVRSRISSCLRAFVLFPVLADTIMSGTAEGI